MSDCTDFREDITTSLLRFCAVLVRNLSPMFQGQRVDLVFSSISFVMSVCLSVRLSGWNNSALTGQIVMRLDIEVPSNNITENSSFINRLTPNDPYMCRTAPLTSKRCILYIYSTNIGTEYFKHALYSPLFFSAKCSLFHNANLFGSCIIHILYTGCAEIKKNNSGAKGSIQFDLLMMSTVLLETCGGL